MPIHFSSNPSMVNQVMAAWQPPVQLDAEHVEGLWADWGWWEVVMWVFLVFGGCVLLLCNAVWLGALAYEWAQIIWTWQKTGQVAVYSLILAAACILIWRAVYRLFLQWRWRQVPLLVLSPAGIYQRSWHQPQAQFMPWKYVRNIEMVKRYGQKSIQHYLRLEIMSEGAALPQFALGVNLSQLQQDEWAAYQQVLAYWQKCRGIA